MHHLFGTLILGLGFSALVSAQEIMVSAAASLTESFKEMGAEFEKQRPGSKVVFNFGASDKLLQQISAGAPVDVFASADELTMDKAVAGGKVDPASRVNFAGNALVLIVPANARTLPKGPKDLLGPAYVHIAIGNPASVPAGRYTKDSLAAQGLWQPLEGRFVLAQSVRQALDYVSRGETEAGFVYATDAALLKGRVKVAGLIPTGSPISYPIAIVEGTPNKALALAFLHFVTHPQGQAILAHHGFSKP